MYLVVEKDQSSLFDGFDNLSFVLEYTLKNVKIHKVHYFYVINDMYHLLMHSITNNPILAFRLIVVVIY